MKIEPIAKRALVIGSQGGIGRAILNYLLNDQSFHEVHSVSRSTQSPDHPRCCHYVVESLDEQAVDATCKQLELTGRFSLVICCIGQLHGEGLSAGAPEKRLESIQSENLKRYFEVNTLAPLNWIKQLPKLMLKTEPTHAVFFSARVGSIEDNQLGGWYGYRASKAALNMLLKTAQIELQRRLPQLSLVSYHPGTVDTDLSVPFQQNVAEKKLFSPAFTVQQLMAHLPDLQAASAPHFIDWQGQRIPW
jgi:NAD(P)-dependent dehydrogenase (short-subunit alcohol dehydrogenase family)